MKARLENPHDVDGAPGKVQADTMTDLKPCPICGKRPVIENHISIFGVSKVCDIRCPSKDHIVRINHCQSKRDAINDWNRRAEPDELPEWALNRINNLRNIVMGSNFRDLKFDLCSDSETFRAVQAGIYKYLSLAMTLRRDDGE